MITTYLNKNNVLTKKSCKVCFRRVHDNKTKSICYYKGKLTELKPKELHNSCEGFKPDLETEY